MTTGTTLDPTPNYDTHLSKNLNFESASTPSDLAYQSSQVEQDYLGMVLVGHLLQILISFVNSIQFMALFIRAIFYSTFLLIFSKD